MSNTCCLSLSAWNWPAIGPLCIAAENKMFVTSRDVTLLKIRVQYTLPRRAKMYWTLIWKSAGFVPFGDNIMAYFGPKSEMTVQEWDFSLGIYWNDTLFQHAAVTVSCCSVMSYLNVFSRRSLIYRSMFVVIMTSQVTQWFVRIFVFVHYIWMSTKVWVLLWYLLVLLF